MEMSHVVIFFISECWGLFVGNFGTWNNSPLANSAQKMIENKGCNGTEDTEQLT